jgi:hypothetical protein
MAGHDELDGGFLQGHHEMGVFLAGETENVLHPLLFQALDEQFRSIHALTTPAVATSVYSGMNIRR